MHQTQHESTKICSMGGPVGNTQINKSTFFNRLLSNEPFRKLWALFRYSDNYSPQWEIQIHVITLNGGNVYMYAQLKQVEGEGKKIE